MKEFLVLFLLLFNVGFTVGKTIHVFGDSHAHFNFTNGGSLDPGKRPKNERSRYFYIDNGIKKSVMLSINWLGPRTMFRVGRDGIKGFDLRNFNVQDGDAAVFVFGEIDVRCHIGKQRDNKGGDLDAVLDHLVNNYVETINQNKKNYHDLVCVIVTPAPPRNVASVDFPYYGTLADRVIITKRLIEKLGDACDQYGFYLLDTYSEFCSENGSLPDRYAYSVHVDAQYNHIIKDKLLRLINWKE